MRVRGLAQDPARELMPKLYPESPKVVWDQSPSASPTTESWDSISPVRPHL